MGVSGQSTISVLKNLKDGLIVSCQAEGNDPFNRPEYLSLFAKAAFMGGAVGIRAEGLLNIKEIKKELPLPIIGLIKSCFPDGLVKITAGFKEVESLMDLHCDIIAIDGTSRKREGLTGPEFISEVKKRYSCCVMADIATYQEAKACFEAGADCVSTTLSGYTPQSQLKNEKPDFQLVKKLSNTLNIPVFAEGRISQAKQAKKMLQYGAWAVVVGTAITRPRVITEMFVKEIKKDGNIIK